MEKLNKKKEDEKRLNKLQKREVSIMKEMKGKEKEKPIGFATYSFYLAMLDPDNKELKKFLKIDIIASIIIAIATIIIIMGILFGDILLSNNVVDLFFISFIVFFILFFITIVRIYFFWRNWKSFWVKYLKPKTLEMVVSH